MKVSGSYVINSGGEVELGECTFINLEYAKIQLTEMGATWKIEETDKECRLVYELDFLPVIPLNL